MGRVIILNAVNNCPHYTAMNEFFTNNKTLDTKSGFPPPPCKQLCWHFEICSSCSQIWQIISLSKFLSCTNEVDYLVFQNGDWLSINNAEPEKTLVDGKSLMFSECSTDIFPLFHEWWARRLLEGCSWYVSLLFCCGPGEAFHLKASWKPKRLFCVHENSDGFIVHDNKPNQTGFSW